MADNKEALPVVTLDKLMNMHLPHNAEDCRITIRIQNPGGLTAHQTVDASGAYFGIDWEARQLVITPRQMLTTLSPEQLEELSASARAGQSWHAYQAHKKHKEREAELRAEVERYKADAERMDWLEQKKPLIFTPTGHKDPKWYVYQDETGRHFSADKSLRIAIDLARSAASGESAEGGG